MAVTSFVQTAFVKGEFSPRLLGRADLRAYFDAAAKLQNFIVEPFGGVLRRSGFRYVAGVKTNENETRLLPFRFSTEQSYAVELGQMYARFYRDRGQLLDAGSPYEITSPYAANQVFGIRFTQSADVLFMTHPDVRPKELRRNGDVDWEFVNFAYDDGPYQEINNDKKHQVKPTSTTGAEYVLTAVTTGTGTFQVTGDRTATGTNDIRVGDIVRVVSSTANNDAYTVASVTLNGANTDVVVNEGILDATVDGSMRVPTTLTANRAMFAQADADSNRHVRIKHTATWGYAKIVSFTSSTVVRATVFENFFSAIYSDQWLLGAFGDPDTDHPVRSAGWPRVVALHGQRLWLASTDPSPQTVWGSVVGDFNNFQPSAANGTVAEDDGVTFTINDDQVNTIYWMASCAKGLYLGTDGAEFVMTGGGELEAITPTSVAVRRHSRYGSRDGPRVVPLGSSALFVAKGGRELRNFAFDFESDQFQAENVMQLSEHATATSPVRDCDLHRAGRTMVWSILDNGTLWCTTLDLAQQVVAWSPQPVAGTNATVESIAVIAEDPFDQLWAVVKRTVNGATVRYVEYMEDDFRDATAQADAFFVDSGLTYSGPPVTVISGALHLRGQTVQVFADGAVLPNEVVSDTGTITLDNAVTKAHVGLGYSSIVTTMPLVLGRAPMDTRGKLINVFKAFVRFHRSIGGSIGRDADNTDVIPSRDLGDPLDEPPPLFTGLKEQNINGQYMQDAQVCVRQDQPLPMNILSLVLNVDLGGSP